MTKVIAALVAIAAITGCGPDPPSSVVGVRVLGCRPHPELGSGMFVEVDGSDRPLVLTSAHVVVGAREITVTRGEASAIGTVVAFDPEMDLAYLDVAGLDASPWVVDSAAIEGGERGVAYVVRGGETVTLAVTVTRRVRIRTDDVYLEGETLRPGYELAADIETGDSGGAVVVGGKVVGVVWARSRRDATRSYAIDPVRAGDLLASQLRTGDLGGVDLTRCP